MARQYKVAKAKLLRYNFIVIQEKLQDPEYAAAVERFFGVPGVADRKYHPWCEVHSHFANNRFPLEIKNETLETLTHLNKYDVDLYHEMTDCLDEGEYNFPAWDPSRFETNKTIQMNYTIFDRSHYGNPRAPSKKWLERFKWRHRPKARKKGAPTSVTA